MQAAFDVLMVRSPFVTEYDRYQDLAERCRDAGVTHLTFTELPRAYWEIDDPDDPYLQWSIVHTSLFKIVPPDLLKDWVPAEYCAQAQESVAKRGAILNAAGIKGAAFLYDPMYWPEDVFEVRPDLRGTRVDHPNRSRHNRYAPCVDHPDVLAMYRESCRQLYELSAGALDVIVMRTNDSGTGFCWSQLYNQPSGPAACQGIGVVQRASTFMQSCLDGIREAGGQARFYVQGTRLVGSAREDIQKLLDNIPPECGSYTHGRIDLGGTRILKGNPSLFPLYPIKGIPAHAEILQKNETGMNMIFIGCLAERWLTRPLVVFPEKLSDEERAHYRPYLFQVNAQHENFKEEDADHAGPRAGSGPAHPAAQFLTPRPRLPWSSSWSRLQACLRASAGHPDPVGATPVLRSSSCWS